MAAGPHADGNRYIGEILRLLNLGLGAHENTPGRHTIAVTNRTAHARRRIADGAPLARALDEIVIFAVGIGPILRALEIFHPFPARLGAAEHLHIELDIKPFVGEEPLFHGDKIIDPHSLGGDADSNRIRHGDFLQ